MIASPSLDQASLLSLCFLDEINDDGVVIELIEVIDEVVSHEKYHDEIEMMGISQIINVVQPKIVSPFNLFGVFDIDVSKVIQTVPTPKLSKDIVVISDIFRGTISPIEGPSNFVGPPLSFDILSRLAFHHDDVFVASFMDLSIFKYLPVSYNDISLSASHSPTLLTFDRDNGIVQHDLDRNSFYHDSVLIDQRVSQTLEDVETVDFGTKNQPRELKVDSPLSTDERQTYSLTQVIFRCLCMVL